MAISYTGFYARFEAPSKKVGGILTGADTLVGDEFEVFFKVEDGISRAWVKNRFGAEIGFLSVDDSRILQLASARGLTIHALLSFVAYSDSPEPGVFWGEMAIICFGEKDAELFEPFLKNVASKLCEGVRIDINLSSQDIAKIEEEPDWLPKGTVFLPETSKGSAIIKSKRLMSEKIVDSGRKGSIGCWIGTIAFFVAVAALIVFGLRSCGVF